MDEIYVNNAGQGKYIIYDTEKTFSSIACQYQFLFLDEFPQVNKGVSHSAEGGIDADVG